MRVQYLALTIFSLKGGIEQVSKNWIYSLSKLSSISRLTVSVLYDTKADTKYIDEQNYKSFSGNKLWFIIKTLFNGINSDLNIFSHIHLSGVALLIKILKPKSKVIFQAHGIEVWRNLSYIQKKALALSNQIICVSHYTKSQLLANNPKLSNKVIVLNNSLDPYLVNHIDEQLRESFRTKLLLNTEDKLLISVGRLNFNEGYKGYDKVIEAISELNNLNIHYHIIGKYDEREYKRVSKIIEDNNLEKRIKLIGYLNDDELYTYYNSGDLFVMPSKGEGFGIVFIEAMLNGLRVIAGNLDGSVDAVKEFNESKLVNPNSKEEIKTAINDLLNLTYTYQNRMELSNKCYSVFNHLRYTKEINNLLIQWK